MRMGFGAYGKKRHASIEKHDSGRCLWHEDGVLSAMIVSSDVFILRMFSEYSVDGLVVATLDI